MSGVDTVELAFIQAQPENAPNNCNQSPIILQHGLTRSKERWKKFMQPLANKTKRMVYAVDARNHGESENSDVFNFDILAEDLADFLRSRNIPRAIVIGHSVGGIAAMKLALTKPEMVELLIVEDMAPKPLVQETCNMLVAIFHEQMECIKKLSASSVKPEGVQQQLRECIYRTVPMIPDADFQALQQLVFPIYETDNGGYALQANVSAISKALSDADSIMTPFVGTFNKPALFIYGENSQMGVPESKETILKLFPKADLHGVQGAAHEVLCIKPEEYEQKVVSFVATLK